MSQENFSAGQPGAPCCSEAATGSLNANPLAPASYELVHNRLRRMRLISEAVGSNLRELRGCEVDRDEMIDALDMLEEMAAQSLESLHFLRPADLEGAGQ